MDPDGSSNTQFITFCNWRMVSQEPFARSSRSVHNAVPWWSSGSRSGIFDYHIEMNLSCFNQVAELFLLSYMCFYRCAFTDWKVGLSWYLMGATTVYEVLGGRQCFFFFPARFPCQFLRQFGQKVPRATSLGHVIHLPSHVVSGRERLPWQFSGSSPLLATPRYNSVFFIPPWVAHSSYFHSAI